ncbi:MAG: hypothetical protein NTW87_26865, partial [Planctomycetota bacterium]|nr:hypothetical protein [Planctomycetota bacterium]
MRSAAPKPSPRVTNAALNGSLLFLSAAALVTQTLAVREVLALTGGNEIIIGLVFGVWFFWSGVGAAVAGWWRLGERLRPGILCFASTLGAGWLPLALVFMARLGASWLETADGRLTGLWHAASGVVLLLAPAPLLSGLLFAAMAAARNPTEGGQGASSAARFSWDALGAAIAGALFTFVLAGRFPALSIGASMGVAGSVAGAVLALAVGVRPRLAAVAVACLPVVCGAALLSIASLDELDYALHTRRPRFASGHETLIAARESRYQQLLWTYYRRQDTVYGDGEAVATYPDQESTTAEAHFVACLAPQLRRVLVAGAAPGTPVRELLRHRPERIDVVELDPEVLALLRYSLSREDKAALADPAVRIHTADLPGFLLQASAGDYDLIWLQPPAPSSVQANRFYTVEFFQRAARVLNERGALTFTTVGAPNYLGPVMADYLGTIHAAVKDAFPFVRVLPGSHERFLAAGQPGVLPAGPDDAVARFEGRKLEVPGFTSQVFQLLWEPDQEAKRAAELEALGRVPANRDLQPRAMLAYLRIWNRYGSSDAADIGDGTALRADRSRVWAALLPLAVVLLLLAVFVARRFRATNETFVVP